jgi:hypothetical protein
MKLSLIFLLFYAFSGFSQSHSYTNPFHSRDLGKAVNFSEKPIHTGIQPLDIYHVHSTLNIDFLPGGNPYLRNKEKSWFLRKLLNEHLFVIDEPDFKLASSFLYKFEKGKDEFSDRDLSFNTRGVFVEGIIGDKTYFFSSFFENQTFFTDYINDYVRKHGVTPGFGRVKGFDEGGYDYSSASGFVSYQAFPNLNFQIGNGKHFVGEGYRSLLLSDMAFFYPYLKITFTKNKFQYTSIFSSFQEVSGYDNLERVHSRKAATFNFLNYIISKHIQIGLFEGIIWESTGENKTSSFNGNMLNPVWGSRVLQFGLDDKNNIILGAQTKISPQKNTQLYFQFLLDKYGVNNSDKRTGLQSGFKLFDIFGIKNLYIQGEYNKVRPYAYSSSTSNQHYSYFNQPLAHPMEANFSELIAILHYSVKNIFIEIKINRITAGIEQDSLFYGSNIFHPYTNPLPQDADIKIFQGNKIQINHLFIKFGYLINKKTNMQIYMGINKRDFLQNNTNQPSNYLFFGLRTALFNEYYDF